MAQKIGAVETAAAFFRQRAAHATADDLQRIMGKVPNVPPTPEDAMPPDLADRLSHLD